VALANNSEPAKRAAPRKAKVHTKKSQKKLARADSLILNATEGFLISNIMKKFTVPADGLEITLPEGKTITRVHLDLAKEGVTLAMVGAASSEQKPGNRVKLKVGKAKEGVSLAMVGAASQKA
jgi:hypothetical protein